MTRPNWKFVQNVCVYTYQPEEDAVIIQPGSLMRAVVEGSVINAPALSRLIVDNTVYTYRILLPERKIPAASPEPGVILYHTFWLKERDDENAYQIIRDYKQTNVFGPEKISFAELDKLYGYKQ